MRAKLRASARSASQAARSLRVGLGVGFRVGLRVGGRGRGRLTVDVGEDVHADEHLVALARRDLLVQRLHDLEDQGVARGRVGGADRRVGGRVHVVEQPGVRRRLLVRAVRFAISCCQAARKSAASFACSLPPRSQTP